MDFSKKEDVTAEISYKFRNISSSTLMTLNEIIHIESLVNAGVRESSKAKKEMIEANLRLQDFQLKNIPICSNFGSNSRRKYWFNESG